MRWAGVLVMWSMSIPALVCLLLVLTALERFGLWFGRTSWLPWKRRPRQNRDLPVSAATFDIFGSVFTDRRVEFAQRESQSMFRDDEAQGAPPRGPIDLDSGRVRLSLSPHPTAEPPEPPSQKPPGQL